MNNDNKDYENMTNKEQESIPDLDGGILRKSIVEALLKAKSKIVKDKYNKEYYQKNKEKLNQYYKSKYTSDKDNCECIYCGYKSTQSNLNRHNVSKKHLKIIERMKSLGFIKD